MVWAQWGWGQLTKWSNKLVVKWNDDSDENLLRHDVDNEGETHYIRRQPAESVLNMEENMHVI